MQTSFRRIHVDAQSPTGSIELDVSAEEFAWERGETGDPAHSTPRSFGRRSKAHASQTNAGASFAAARSSSSASTSTAAGGGRGGRAQATVHAGPRTTVKID